MKKLSILGSTGSIGKNTIEVVRRFPDRFRVVGLAANSNIQLLEEQIKICKPEVVAVYNESAGRRLKKKNLPVEILTGEKGLTDLATHKNADIVVTAIVGSAGLLPTFTAVRAGKDIALASKEALVMAGSIIMNEAQKKGVKIIPVDSEHSAVFQCVHGRKEKEIQKIILTASGGPFLNKSASELKTVTPDTALMHPNWLMGKKISIDSATLMNKGLEVIEAHWLFRLPLERIEVLLHPQSIVHSMVEFVDGSVMAQMSVPDMKGPIAYALSYPQRCEHVIPPLDLSKTGMLTFEKPDLDKYRCLSLTYDALRAGGTMPSVLNAANEVAVGSFLENEIQFTDIPEVVADTMSRHEVSDCKTMEGIIEASNWAGREAGKIVQSLVRDN
jgi:1-deoxy-D-xylulose-5-phosphate reductoisomerase